MIVSVILRQLLMLLTGFWLLTAVTGCVIDSSQEPSREEESGSARVELESARICDLREQGLAVSHEGPLPGKASCRTFVPWSDVAILEVMPEGSPHAGALVVRYGWGQVVDEGGAATLYLLEGAGPNIEPLSLQWARRDGSAELTAIARVGGVLRRYDFDRGAVRSWSGYQEL